MNARSGPADERARPTVARDDGPDVRSVLLYPSVFVFPRTERTEGERRV